MRVAVFGRQTRRIFNKYFTSYHGTTERNELSLGKSASVTCQNANPFQFLHSWFPLQSSHWAAKVGRDARFCLGLRIYNLSGRVFFFYSIVLRVIRDTGYKIIWVQPCELLGMAHLLVAVPMRISISYLQATVHLINHWISGFCCGTANVCSSRSVYIGVCKASESTTAGLSALAPQEHTSMHFCL